MQPSIIIAKCCDLLGCEACVDQWYSRRDMAKNCPACGRPRGYTQTMRIHGLDDLLKSLKGNRKLEPSNTSNENNPQ